MNYISALENIVNDLFAAGTETVGTTLKWVIRYAVEFPEEAKRCQAEIDRIVPTGSLVSLQHRDE